MKRTYSSRIQHCKAIAVRFTQWLYVLILFATGALWWAERCLRKSGAIVVLMFHRVLPDEEGTDSLPGMVVRERAFEDLAEYLVSAREVVKVEDARPTASNGELRFAYTFDDGWLDTYQVAFPIASRYGVPFTTFLCSSLMDTVDPFWPEVMVRRLKASKPHLTTAELEQVVEEFKMKTPEARDQAMAHLSPDPQSSSFLDRTISWKQAREMAEGAFRFGSHSSHHEILTTLELEQVRGQLALSKHRLEQMLHTPCRTLAYPNGCWNADIAALARKSGFHKAFTTQRGAWTSHTDPLAIPRCNVAQDDLVSPFNNFSRAWFLYRTVWKSWLEMKSSRQAVRSSVPLEAKRATTGGAS